MRPTLAGLLLGLALGVSPAAAADPLLPAEPWHVAWRLDANSGLPDDHVLGAERWEQHVYAATPSGLYRYDLGGLRWSTLLSGQAVHGVRRVGDRLYALAADGVYLALAPDAPVQPVGGSPGGGRDIVDLGGGAVVVVGTRGAQLWRNGSWLGLQLPAAATCAFAGDDSLHVGTAGGGIFRRGLPVDPGQPWVRERAGSFREELDRLQGDYIHSIGRAPGGELQVVTALADGLDPRYTAYQNAVRMGLVDEEHPLDWFGAALATRVAPGAWENRFLYQDLASEPRTVRRGQGPTLGKSIVATAWAGVVPGSARPQLWTRHDDERRYPATFLEAFDLESGEWLWRRPTTGGVQHHAQVVPGRGLAVICAGHDQGRRVGERRDDRARLHVIDAAGATLARIELQGMGGLPVPVHGATRWPTWLLQASDGEVPTSALMELDPATLQLRTVVATGEKLSHVFVGEDPRNGERFALFLRRHEGRDVVTWLDLESGHERSFPVPPSLEARLGDAELTSPQPFMALRPAGPQLMAAYRGALLCWQRDGWEIVRRVDGMPHLADILGGPAPELMLFPLRGVGRTSLLRLPGEPLEARRRHAWQPPLRDWASTPPLRAWPDAGAVRSMVPLRLPEWPDPWLGDVPALGWGSVLLEDGTAGWYRLRGDAPYYEILDLEGRVRRIHPLPVDTLGPPEGIVDMPLPGASRPARTERLLTHLRGHHAPILRVDMGTGQVLARYDPPPQLVDAGVRTLPARLARRSLQGSEAGVLGVPGSRLRTHELREVERGVLHAGDGGVEFLQRELASCVDPHAERMFHDGDALFLSGAERTVRVTATGDRRQLPHSRYRDHSPGIVVASPHVYTWVADPARNTGKLTRISLEDGRQVEMARLFHPEDYEGNIPQVNDLQPLSGGRLLAATNWGLFQLSAEEGLRELDHPGAEPLSILARGDSLLVGARDGGLSLWMRDGDRLEARGEITRAEGPVEFLAAGPGGDTWYGGGSRAGRLRLEAGDAHFEAPVALADSIRVTALGAAGTGAAWVGTTRGLHRLDARQGVLLRARVPGLPPGETTSVADLRQRGEGELRAVFVGVRGQGSWRFDMAPASRARLHAIGEGYRLGSPDGSIGQPHFLERGRGWVPADHWIRHEGGNWMQLAPSLDEPGRLVAQVAGADPFGRLLVAPGQVEFVQRLHSPQVDQALLVLLVGLGCAWVLSYRIAPRRRWALAVLAGGGLLPLGVREALYLEVPWLAAGSSLALLVAVGWGLRQRESVRLPGRDEARRELRQLSKGYRHRGSELDGGINLADELVLPLLNWPHYYASERDPERPREAARRLLRATDQFAQRWPELRPNAGLPAWLEQRLGRAVDELRTQLSGIPAAPRELLAWLDDPRLRMRAQASAREFHRAMEELATELAEGASCDLAALVADTRVRLVAEGRDGLTVRVEAPGSPCPAAIAVGAAEEIVDNLVGNALQATQGRPSRVLCLRAQVDGAHATLEVEDDGPGFPVELGERVLEPGVSGRGGSGFGLGRVVELARSAGGAVEIGQSAELGGARVGVRLQRVEEGDA